MCSVVHLLTSQTVHAGIWAATRGVAVPAAGTDSVAEALLDCYAVLLQRCPPQSSEQLLELLERIGLVVSLPGKAAAEEVLFLCSWCTD